MCPEPSDFVWTTAGMEIPHEGIFTADGRESFAPCWNGELAIHRSKGKQYDSISDALLQRSLGKKDQGGARGRSLRTGLGTASMAIRQAQLMTMEHAIRGAKTASYRHSLNPGHAPGEGSLPHGQNALDHPSLPRRGRNLPLWVRCASLVHPNLRLAWKQATRVTSASSEDA